MVALSLLLLTLSADPDDGLAKKMLPVYLREAGEYSIAVESEPKKPLELRKEPVFEWSNPVRSGLQQGVVFLWHRDGRPAAIGCVFSHPEDRFTGRRVLHEFHALDPEKLIVTRPGALNEWKPQAGLERKELADAPAPAATPSARLVQMRRLAREFTGHGIDDAGKKWDLRLLPSPLYRSPEAKTGVMDGAIFTFASTAGTDPEVLLLLEAREEKGQSRWQFACARFSDRSLYMHRNEKEVWSTVRSASNTFLHDEKHLFRFYPDKVVDADGKVIARVRATDTAWDFIPVVEKNP